jgi:hypothetical protein
MLPERSDLNGNALAVGRYPRIAVNHGFFLHQSSAPKKLQRFKGLILVRNF